MADHIAERIPEEMRKEIAKNPTGDLNKLRLIDSDQTGSTACVVLIR